MFRNRTHEARKIAEVPTLERMRLDGKKLPPQLSRLMTYLVRHLFDLDLNAARAWRGAGIRDHSLSTTFRAAIGGTLRTYIEPGLESWPTFPSSRNRPAPLGDKRRVLKLEKVV